MSTLRNELRYPPTPADLYNQESRPTGISGRARTAWISRSSPLPECCKLGANLVHCNTVDKPRAPCHATHLQPIQTRIPTLTQPPHADQKALVPSANRYVAAWVALVVSPVTLQAGDPYACSSTDKSAISWDLVVINPPYDRGSRASSHTRMTAIQGRNILDDDKEQEVIRSCAPKKSEPDYAWSSASALAALTGKKDSHQHFAHINRSCPKYLDGEGKSCRLTPRGILWNFHGGAVLTVPQLTTHEVTTPASLLLDTSTRDWHDYAAHPSSSATEGGSWVDVRAGKGGRGGEEDRHQCRLPMGEVAGWEVLSNGAPPNPPQWAGSDRFCKGRKRTLLIEVMGVTDMATVSVDLSATGASQAGVHQTEIVTLRYKEGTSTASRPQWHERTPGLLGPWSALRGQPLCEVMALNGHSVSFLNME
ncbi:hypothetical protein BV22DRAFT_1050404 [Leucogyrophana mollusca]|uniref:Uncharacterized protein n=1 Tax=Leucogyrophana mollusca TaxID=85980 RepID=A0ACB8B5A1_9AGAM|nr:hypothetical protein BV22DRAFT_1050404 [Leucogyrophana mollusca]